MKKVIAALLISSVLVPAYSSATFAAKRPVCTSETRDAEVPSGTQTDSNGRTWVGFKAGGLPPDSLSKSSDATLCEDAYDD